MKLKITKIVGEEIARKFLENFWELLGYIYFEWNLLKSEVKFFFEFILENFSGIR